MLIVVLTCHQTIHSPFFRQHFHVKRMIYLVCVRSQDVTSRHEIRPLTAVRTIFSLPNSRCKLLAKLAHLLYREEMQVSVTFLAVQN